MESDTRNGCREWVERNDLDEVIQILFVEFGMKKMSSRREMDEDEFGYYGVFSFEIKDQRSQIIYK